MPQKPLVGVFTKQLDNWTSGSGHHLNEMMKQILRMNTKLRFAFIHYKKSENPIYQLADEEIIIPRNPFKASRILARKNFAVIHYTPLTFFAPIWGIKAKKTATIHGVEQLLVPQFYGTLEMAHERFLVPVYARKMDHIITVSQASNDFFIKHYRVKPERVTVCPNAVGEEYRLLPEHEKMIPAGLTTLTGVAVTKNDKYVYHISRFSERKNPWTILKGYADFSNRNAGKTSKLVIAGGRWDNPDVLNMIKELKIENRVSLAGFVDEDMAIQLYNNAQVFIFPSLAEGFGIPNIEAMACGCPVITSKIFAIPEVIGNAALLMDSPTDYVELGNKIEELYINETTRIDLISKGIDRANRFRSWQSSAEKMLTVWEELTHDK